VRSPNEKDRSLPKTVRRTLIDVREIDPPADVEAIDWQLLTTHEVATTDKAWLVIGWYQLRWCIEQLFRIMKSQGLQLEDSQMDPAERLTKLTAAAVKAACITLQLVQERDGTHGLPAELVFSEAETDTIEALIPTLEGKTERQKNPHPPRGLARASWVIARLAVGTAIIGHLGPSPCIEACSASMPFTKDACSRQHRNEMCESLRRSRSPGPTLQIA
jgi:hypothetical protein